jgi:hypothetical protein
MSSADADLVISAIDPQPEAEGGSSPARPVLMRLEKTTIGHRMAGGAVTVRRRERPGCVLYGPYWRLPAGAYRLAFRCRCGRPRLSAEPVLGVEVIAMNRVQLAWRDLTAAELEGEAGALFFSVPPMLGLGAGDEARVEFRFFHMGNAPLTIADVALHGPDTDAQAPDAPRLWRMLGRLELTAIAQRRAGRVAVRRRRRAGCLLDGGKPPLQLPRGRYRLNVVCAAGPVRIATAPVMAVEVVARRRWQEGRRPWRRAWPPGTPATGDVALAWRDFTAPELCSAPATIEFTVPTEFALEGGQDVVIALRLLHLGNADLRISAVELREAEPTSAPPPMRWRLLGRPAKAGIGKPGPEGVTVRRSEPPGALLYGGRLAMPLPQGRYQLSLCARSGTPQSASDPVVACEVIASTWRRFLKTASSLQLRCDFTADALAAGRVAVEFEVPPRLSREHDAGAGFAFAIRHLGNADVTVSALDLDKIPTAEDVSRAPAPSVRGQTCTNVLVIGNCQAQTIYEGLIRAGELNRRLNAKYHFVGLQQNLIELGRAELASSEVLLVQDIRDWQHYPLRQYIGENVRIIKFPLLHFASLWPFDHYNGPGDKEAYEREWPNLTFLYHDGLLARLRKEIPDREQRLAAYRSLSVDGVINFVRLHDFEKRRLLAMDRQFGLQIGQFILDNFRRRQLFYTTNHPNAEIMTMLIQHLLRQLGIAAAYRPSAILDHLNRLQVPVHPKVATALGVKWANENTKYRYGGEEITWETYIRRYIEHYG